MPEPEKHIIYTIGHSTRSLNEFIEMLQSFGIRELADIRSFPGSRRFPQFNKENLKLSLAENGIHYRHIEALGGRRKRREGSQNNRWRNDSFRGYADYMETPEFENAIKQLEDIAAQITTAYMCSEAVWWRCHRSLVSDYLKAKGWKVMHILSVRKAEEHPYTSPAIVTNGKVSYSDKGLFD